MVGSERSLAGSSGVLPTRYLLAGIPYSYIKIIKWIRLYFETTMTDDDITHSALRVLSCHLFEKLAEELFFLRQDCLASIDLE